MERIRLLLKIDRGLTLLCARRRIAVDPALERGENHYMARLSIHLPDDLRSKAEARAAEAGHPNVEQYVEALVRADVQAVGHDYGAPEHLSVGDDAEVEALLFKRL